MRYRVLIHGKNITISENSFLKTVGFFTTRFVSADNEEKAKLYAEEKVKQEIAQLVTNNSEINAVEISKVTWKNPMYFFKSGKGFTFYDTE